MASLLTHARTMRQMPTAPEAALWRALRAEQLGGMKFRRQQPIGPFIVDFFCPEVGLIVEVDGETHADSLTDRSRDAWLAERGYRVVRVWNNEVLENLTGVLETILAAARTPPPTPSLKGRGLDLSTSPDALVTPPLTGLLLG